MTFLAPWTALLAAALAVPALVLLYVLKLRRRRLRMASTMLWRRSSEDLQVNVPFRRLRLSPLFVLQLLALIMLLVAAAEPVLQPAGTSASRVILLVDRSASMSASDVERDGAVITRLDAARDAARAIVDRLMGGSTARSVMVVAFGARAQLVTGFEARREVVLDAIASIEPTDEEADLASALQLAGTFAASGEQDRDEPPDVVLISDGGVASSEEGQGFSLRGGQFRYVRVGPGVDARNPVRNVGIVSLSARRDYADPARVLVFARLLNAGVEPVDTFVTLLIDDAAGPVRRVTIPPADAAPGASAEAGPDVRAPAGEASASFAVTLPTAAVLRVRHSARDVLRHDDTAAVVLPPPARPRIALVHHADGPDPYLEELLRQTEPAQLRLMTESVLLRDEQEGRPLERRFDLVVFDGVTPSRLPGIPSLTFGVAPPGVDLVPASTPGGQRILSWRRQHVLMRHVSLDPIVYAGAGGLRLAPEGTALATGRDGPVIALLSERSAQHVVVAFRLARSNWPTHVSVTVFIQNVLEYLTLARSGQSSAGARPGEPVTVRHDGVAAELTISGPDLERSVRPASSGARVTLPILRRAGLYTVEGAVPPGDRIAVSVLSDVESDIRPRERLLVNARAIDAGAVHEAAPRAIWAWFIGAAVALLVVEWLLYCWLARRG